MHLKDTCIGGGSDITTVFNVMQPSRSKCSRLQWVTYMEYWSTEMASQHPGPSVNNNCKLGSISDTKSQLSLLFAFKLTKKFAIANIFTMNVKALCFGKP